MPIYEYECQTCHVIFELREAIHTFEFDPVTQKGLEKLCPNCRSKDTRRIISPVTIVFRGDGFYSTDSKEAIREK